MLDRFLKYKAFTIESSFFIIKYVLFALCLLSSSNADAEINYLDSANYYKLKDYNKARQFASRIIENAEKSNNQNYLAKGILILGNTHYYEGNQDSALFYYLKSLKIYETLKHESGISEVMNEMGILFLKQKKYTEAKKILLESARISSTSNSVLNIATANNNLGLVYNDLKQSDSAEYYFNKALNKYRSLKDTLGISYALDYLSSVYLNTNRPEKAEANLIESILLRGQLNDKTGLAIAINNLGELYLSQKKYKQALEQFKAASDSAKNINFLDLEAYTYKMQSEVYKQLGDYKRSLVYSELFQDTNEKMLNEKRIHQIEELNTQYETQKKENEIQQQKLKLSKRNILLGTLSVIFVLAVISFYLLYNSNKLKQETLMQEELLREQQMRSKAVIEAEENERQRIAKELHDSVGQLLSATKLNFNAATSTLTTNDEFNSKLNNGLQLLDDSIKEVRSISHNMMPSVLQENGLCAAISDFIRKINNSELLQIKNEMHDVQENRFDKTAQLMLYRIIQESFNNIVKHAQANTVNMECVGHENEVVIIIEDNGIGFDTTSNNEGIGLKNIRLRVDYLKGKFDIDSAKGKGTTTIFEIPYTD